MRDIHSVSYTFTLFVCVCVAGHCMAASTASGRFANSIFDGASPKVDEPKTCDCRLYECATLQVKNVIFQVPRRRSLLPRGRPRGRRTFRDWVLHLQRLGTAHAANRQLSTQPVASRQLLNLAAKSQGLSLDLTLVSDNRSVITASLNAYDMPPGHRRPDIRGLTLAASIVSEVVTP